MALKIAKHYTELVKSAKLLEAEGDTEQAAALYEDAIRQKPFETVPYERLMVYYRKQKNYEAELKVIKKALSVFLEHYEKKPEKLMGKDPRLIRLSKALLKTVNKNHNSEVYYPEPIPKWTRRKETVEKKLGT
jgi:tetratricopeptide (TPR) repeat protein